MVYRSFFCTIFIFLSVAVSAQVKFKQSWYYTAVDTVSYQHIARKAFIQMEKGHRGLPFHNKGIYWFALDIDNSYPGNDLIISIANPHLDSVFLFREVDGKVVPADTSGNNFKHQERSYLRYVRFRVQGNTGRLWLKTRLKKEILFPVTINTAADFHQAESLSFLKLGIYYGIAAIALIINLALYFSFKEPKFLYYSILLVMIAMLYGYADGLYPLVSRNPIWLNYASLPVMLGAATASVVFSAKFLELDNRYRGVFWASAVLLAFMASCFLAYLVFGWTGAVILGNMMLPLLLAIYWSVGLTRFKKHTEARFFVLASALSLLFTLNFFIFRFAGANFLKLMPSELKFGNILQMFFLSVAILYRMKKLREEHAYYREEIQRYLNEQPLEQQPSELEVSPVQDVFMQLQEQFSLSEREIDVLKLLAEGLTNQQIGDKLYLSANTVKFHIRNIYLKMGISNRTQAVSRMLELG